MRRHNLTSDKAVVVYCMMFTAHTWQEQAITQVGMYAPSFENTTTQRHPLASSQKLVSTHLA